MLVSEGLDIGLGASGFKKALTKVRKVATAPFKLHRKLTRKIFKKIAPKSFQGFVSRFGVKGKAAFIKAAPWIAIAAQILNFIPGLGIAVSLAITAAATAIQLTAAGVEKAGAKKVMKKAEAAEDAEIRKLDEEIKVERNKADDAAVEAYDKGEEYFNANYGMDREAFKSLSMEDKAAFLTEAVVDKDPNLGKMIDGLVGGVSLPIWIAAAIIATGGIVVLMVKKYR